MRTLNKTSQKKKNPQKRDNKTDYRLLNFCGKFLSLDFMHLLVYILTLLSIPISL